MEPNQQQPAPQNPYGFIMDSQHPKKQRLPGGSGSSMKSRLLVITGALIVLIIGFMVVSALLSSGQKSRVKNLTSLAAQQAEIIRISDLGVKSATSTTTLALAETTKLSVSTQQSKLLKYLKERKIKVESKDLITKQNKQTDAEFKEAVSSNKFEDVFTATIKERLVDYAKELKTNYEQASNEVSKKLLSESFDSTAQLLK